MRASRSIANVSSSILENSAAPPSDTTNEALSEKMARIAQKSAHVQESVILKKRSRSLWHRVPKSRVILQKHRDNRHKSTCFAATEVRKSGVSKSMNEVIEQDVSKRISRSQAMPSYSSNKQSSYKLSRATKQGFSALIGCKIY